MSYQDPIENVIYPDIPLQLTPFVCLEFLLLCHLLLAYCMSPCRLYILRADYLVIIFCLKCMFHGVCFPLRLSLLALTLVGWLMLCSLLLICFWKPLYSLTRRAASWFLSGPPFISFKHLVLFTPLFCFSFLFFFHVRKVDLFFCFLI